MNKVKIKNGEIIIPTYNVAMNDQEPPLINEMTPRGAPIYPYKTQEVISENRKEKEYRAVFLENDYIRLTFLPELNGRLYSAYDKINNNELFYANPTVKPGLFSVRGAWPAIGIEFNFPNSHTTTTMEEVSCITKEYHDGSASVVVGDIEMTGRMGWCVEIKLSPDSNLIAMESKLYNPTEFPQRYYYWINAACPCYGETEFIYPPSTKRLLTHPPMDASRLAFLNWPLHEGCRINYFKNINQHFPVFAEKMEDDFYGIYHHNKNYGLIHIADRNLVRGRKLWMFGNARDGKIFIDLLSEESADYCELQTGPFTLQSDYRMLKPGRMYIQRDYWAPIANTGGFNFFCREFGAKISLDKYNESIEIKICGITTMKNIKVVVYEQDENLDSTIFNTTPGTTLKLSLACRKNSEIFFYDNNDSFLSVYKVNTSPDTLNDLEISDIDSNHNFLQGKYREEQGIENQAATYYANATSDDLQSKLAEARLACTNGENKKGRRLLNNLLRIDRSNCEALLLLGSLNLTDGRYKEAEMNFSKAANDNQYRDKALHKLIYSVIIKRNYNKAFEIIDELIHFGIPSANVYALKALCEFKSEIDCTESLQLAENIFFMDPLLLAIKFLFNKNIPSQHHLCIEAACSLIRLKYYDDAVEILNTQINNISDALSVYYIAWMKHKLGAENSALKILANATSLKWPNHFASRNETEEVLRYVLQINNNDTTANYQLGCLLAYKKRWSEAIRFWKNCSGDLLNDAMRNTALYHWKIKKDTDQAAKYFNRAINKKCGNLTLIEAERFYEETAYQLNRITVFKDQSKDRENDSRYNLSKARTLLVNDRASEALDIMLNNRFSLIEGKMLSRDTYEQIYAALATTTAKNGNPESAATLYLKATEYPENIGIGKPSNNKESEWYFKAGEIFTQINMQKKAEECYNKGAARGEFFDLDFFPIKRVVWEASWENIDVRYWKNIIYRIRCLKKIKTNDIAGQLKIKVKKYLIHLSDCGRDNEKETIILKELYNEI
jgi:cytochrome c-type biogenesis protein CcmH/NrfG